MSELICTGLDGSNPLHVLAGLGLLQIASTATGTATMHWQRGTTWHPVIRCPNPWTIDEGLDAAGIAAVLRRLAAAGERDQAQERQARELQTQRKKKLDQAKVDRAALKEGLKGVSPELRKERLLAFETTLDRALADLDRQLTEAQELVNDALGAGVAHLGDIIGVNPGIFRRKAEQSCQAWLRGETLGQQVPAVLIADAMSSQGSDAITDSKGLVQNTSLSFSNGASGQCLLKAFRTLAAAVTIAQVAGTLTGSPERYLPGATPLNWDPADQRDYALTWSSPEDKQANPKQTDVAANALALIGLSLLTACPQARRLDAVGWQQHGPGQGFTWPMWTAPITAPTVRALMGAIPVDVRHRHASGIVEVFTARRINPTGKRNFFAPAHPV